jgi:hypothetical protein
MATATMISTTVTTQICNYCACIRDWADQELPVCRLRLLSWHTAMRRPSRFMAIHHLRAAGRCTEQAWFDANLTAKCTSWQCGGGP